MKEIINETYYLSDDGQKFKTKNECEEYENFILRENEILKQISDLEKELAIVQYNRIKETEFIKSAVYGGGCGHDGYFCKCPCCGTETGGYGYVNLKYKVDNNIYKCTKCGEFFKYI